MKALLRRIRQILKDRRTRRFLTRFVSGIAAVVVFVTTYALVLPAITMESEAACGIEAHQHDDSCYTENLICGQEESEGHHHTDDCFTVTMELECDLEEHQHSLENGCFDEEGNLVCKVEEHTHSDSCYQEHRELTCGLEETEGHHHTDSCYEKVLSCGKEVHTHSTSCYKADLKIESAAVTSTGMTSAAAVPNLSDEDIYSEEPEHSQDDPAANEALDEQDQTDEDEEHTDKERADEDAENGDSYIPEKEELEFKTVLNRRTGIYYHHVAEDEEIEDSSAITDWDKADKDTELNRADIIRMYLSYTLPRDTVNATNDIARYRLPDSLHLTDEQVDAINECENGISSQYIEYDSLEITDVERHTAYLGLESVEGTRRPGEEPEEDDQEYISATVKAEKIYDEETGEYEGTDLIFTFSPYTVEKNAHAYDKKGQPTRAGEEVTGWLTLDFNMGQIDWAEDNTSEIIFAEEDRENKVSEISTVLKQADPSQAEDDDLAAAGMTEAAAEDMTADEDAADAATETAAADETAETAAQDATEEAAAADVTAEETAAADNTVDKAEEAGTEKTAAEAPDDEKDKKEESVAAGYPAAVFDDSITVRSGRLDTDLADTDIPRKTKMTVHVEADEGTFPEGTKMVLSAVDDLDAVAEAVGTAVDAKTRGFQAVDITFYDKDPSAEDAKEIEPLKPIRVSIKSDEIRKAAEDSSTAPVVVHIEDNNKATEIENTASATDNAAIEIEKPASDQGNTNDAAIPSDDSSIAATSESTEDENTAAEDDAVTFEADSFSIYAVVYTVDFSWEVDGKEYIYSLVGGESISVSQLAAALNIIPEETISSFAAEVANVTFSDESLVAVCHAEANTTARMLIQANGLDIEYSAILTDEQIAGLERREYAAGEWVLLCQKAFDTEEILTITMRNGDTWTVAVTDEQAVNDPLNLHGKKYAIVNTKNGRNSALTTTANGNNLSNLYVTKNNNSVSDTAAEWSFEYVKSDGDNNLYLVHYGQYYLKIENGKISVTDRETAMQDANLISIKKNGEKYRFTNAGETMALNNYGNNGFGPWNGNNNDEWMSLCTADIKNAAANKPENMIDTTDTRSAGFRINLFDYGPDSLDDVGNTFNSPDTSGINSGHELQFYSYGTSGSGKNNFTGGATAHQGIVKSNLGADGYPVVNSSRGESLAYLFDETPNGSNKKVYSDVNHLFYQDADGYYRYNSDTSYAYYDPAQGSGGDFKVYDGTYTEEGADSKYFAIGLYPFNDYDERYRCIHGDNFRWGCTGSRNTHGVWDEVGHYNHHFGISMDGDFVMPEDKKVNGNHMVYEFSGDDDMWVFIDGVLVLDIGGIHNPVSGKIDFTTGAVTVSDARTASGGVENNAALGKNSTIAEAFQRAGKTWDDSVNSKHEIRIFYMERGGMYSNCEITFNIPTVTLADIEFDKVNDSDNTIEDAVFKLYSDLECTKPVTDKGVEIVVTSEADKHPNVTIKNIPVGITYYLREESAPAGLLKDSRVYVVEAPSTPDNSKIYVYGDDTQSHVSKIVNIEPKYGNITFKKIDENTQAELENATFALYTDPDCKNPYKANPSDTNGVTATSLSNGTVTFTNLPANSTYYFKETSEPAGYIPSTEIFRAEIDSTGNVVRIFRADGTEIIGDTKTITNKPKGGNTSITVEKEWADGNRNHSKDTVTVELWRVIGDPEYPEEPAETVDIPVSIDWNGKDPGNVTVTATFTTPGEEPVSVDLTADSWLNIVTLKKDKEYSVSFDYNPKGGKVQSVTCSQGTIIANDEIASSGVTATGTVKSGEEIPDNKIKMEVASDLQMSENGGWQIGGALHDANYDINRANLAINQSQDAPTYKLNLNYGYYQTPLTTYIDYDSSSAGFAIRIDTLKMNGVDSVDDIVFSSDVGVTYRMKDNGDNKWVFFPAGTKVISIARKTRGRGLENVLSKGVALLVNKAFQRAKEISLTSTQAPFVFPLNAVKVQDAELSNGTFASTGQPATVTLNSGDNGWSYTWTGLKETTNDDKKITYYVKEVSYSIHDMVEGTSVDTEYVNPEYNDDGSLKKITVLNTVVKPISLDVTKEWYKANGSTPHIPSSDAEKKIYFDVYQVLDGQTPGTKLEDKSGVIEYDSNTGTWDTVTVSNLPVKVKDNDGAVHDATYYIKETSTGGYVTSYKINDGVRLEDASSSPISTDGAKTTIVNTDGDRQVTVTKRWYLKEGNNKVEASEPSRKEVRFQLICKEDDQAYKKPGSNTDIYTLTWTAESGWSTETFDQLEIDKHYYIQELDTQNKPITSDLQGYTEISYKDPDGNSVTADSPFSGSSVGIYTIENVQKSTSLYVEKQWYGIDSENITDGKKVWFSLHRVQTDEQMNNVIPGTDEEVMRFAFSDSNGWIRRIDNLEIAPLSSYQDEGHAQRIVYRYYVKELGFKINENATGTDDGENNNYQKIDSNMFIRYQAKGSGTSQTNYSGFGSGIEDSHNNPGDALFENDINKVRTNATYYDGTGTLGVFNSATEFLKKQLFIDKKWFSQNGGGTAWNEINSSQDDRLKNYKIALQLMQVATFKDGGTTYKETIEYGSLAILGKDRVIRNSNAYEITSVGNWSYKIAELRTIPGTNTIVDQLPAKGPFAYKVSDSAPERIYLATFDYYVSEMRVYDENDNEITSEWTPATQIVGDNTYEVYNRETSDLTLHKQWENISQHFVNTNVQGLYFTVHSKCGENVAEDITEAIYNNPTTYGLTANDVEKITYKDSGNQEVTKYVVRISPSNASAAGSSWGDDSSLKIANLDVYERNYVESTTSKDTSVAAWPTITYSASEVAYLDGSGVIHAIEDLDGNGTGYPKYAEKSTAASAWPSPASGTSTSAIPLGKPGDANLLAVNTAKGLIKVHKKWQDPEGHNVNAWNTSVTFKLQQIRKLASDEAEVLDPIDYKIGDTLQTYTVQAGTGDEWITLVNDLPLQVTVHDEQTNTDAIYNCYYRAVEIEPTTKEEVLSSVQYESNDGKDSDIEQVEIININLTPVDIKVLKTDTSATPKYLPGAVFKFTKKQNGAFKDFEFHAEDNSTATPTAITFEEGKQGQFTVTNGQKGVTIKALTTGVYKLEEIKSPDGYNKLMNPIEFEITNDGKVIAPGFASNSGLPVSDSNIFVFTDTSSGSTHSAAVSVKNTPGAELPSTGGPGTGLFTLFGSILILGAGVLLWRRRRTL